MEIPSISEGKSISKAQQCMLQILDHLLRQHSENKKLYPNFLISSITLDGMWWAEYLKNT